LYNTALFSVCCAKETKLKPKSITTGKVKDKYFFVFMGKN
jgi:hypothetical protein